MEAVAAIQKAGVQLKGDLIISGVVGEIEKAQIGRFEGKTYRGAGVGPSPAYSYSAAVLEVDVDPETGIYRVPKIWIAHDGGTSLNPTLVMRQVEGSVYMGLSEALMEAAHGVEGLALSI